MTKNISISLILFAVVLCGALPSCSGYAVNEGVYERTLAPMEIDDNDQLQRSTFGCPLPKEVKAEPIYGSVNWMYSGCSNGVYFFALGMGLDITTFDLQLVNYSNKAPATLYCQYTSGGDTMLLESTTYLSDISFS
eukprot:Nk52_evm13s1869 gene=Nk52_evmTU13s1869